MCNKMNLVWCNPNRLYDFDEPVLCWTGNNKCVCFTETKNLDHWNWLVQKYNIIAWIYQFRLRPSIVV